MPALWSDPLPCEGWGKGTLIQHIFPFSTAALAQDSTWESDLPINVKWNTCRLLACTKWEWKPTQTKAERAERRACRTDPSQLIFIAYSPCSRHSSCSRWFWSTFQTQGLMTLSPHSGRLYAWCPTSPSWDFAHISFLLQKFSFIISISWLENKWGHRVVDESQDFPFLSVQPRNQSSFRVFALGTDKTSNQKLF